MELEASLIRESIAGAIEFTLDFQGFVTLCYVARQGEERINFANVAKEHGVEHLLLFQREDWTGAARKDLIAIPEIPREIMHRMTVENASLRSVLTSSLDIQRTVTKFRRRVLSFASQVAQELSK